MTPYSVISPAPRDAWSSVLESDPDALPSLSPEWIDAVCTGSPWRDASRLYVLDCGRRIVFPMTSAGADRRFRMIVSPRRGWGFGGIIADGGVTKRDIAVVSEDLAHTNAVRLRIRPNPLHTEMWDAFAPEFSRVQRVAHVVDLSGGPEAVRSGFHRSAKKGITTAERNGVRIETVPGAEFLGTFFMLAHKSREFAAERQHEPVWLAQMRGRLRDSEKKWDRIARSLGSRLEVSVAWYGERPAAAGIVLCGPNAHGMRAAMDPELRKIGATHLLNWVVLQNACNEGAHWFHMGESATAGVEQFKESFGARRVEYAEIEHERLPFSRADNLLRSAVKRIIRFEKEPVPVGAPVGPATAPGRNRAGS